MAEDATTEIQDYEEGIFVEAFGDDIDRLNTDIDDEEDLQDDLDKLLTSAMAIETFGISPTTMALLGSAQLLVGTSLDTIAFETYRTESAEGTESQLVLESLGQKISAKMSQWSARILHITKEGTDRVLAILNPIWTKISDQVKSLSNKAWDATKTVGKTIRAHPYKTMAAVVAAAAAVAGIVIFVSHNAPLFEADESMLDAFVNKTKDMVNRIRWPFDKSPYAEVRVNGGPMIYCAVETSYPQVKTTGPAAALGWTKTAVKSISGQMGRVFTQTRTGLVNVTNRLYDYIEQSKAPERYIGGKAWDTALKVSGGSKWAGHYAKKYSVKIYKAAIFAVGVTLFKLVSKVVLTAFRLVRDLFATLMMMVDREPANT